MDFKDVCKALGWREDASLGLPAVCWEESEKAYPAGKEEEGLFFLQEAFLDRYISFFHVESYPEIRADFKRTAGIIWESEALRHLIWHLHFVLFRAEVFYTIGNLPETPLFNKEEMGIFYRILQMSNYPLLEKNYAKWGIPFSYLETIFATYSPPPPKFANSPFGKYGLAPRALYWGRRLLEGKIFQVGRLQYEIHEGFLPGGPFVFRGKTKGDIRLMAPPRWRYDANGVRLNEYDESAVLVTEYEDMEECYKGRELLGNFKLGEDVALSKEEYAPLVQQGDLILDIHIPTGGKMTPEAVKSSLWEALEFFPKYFKRQVKLFVCTSWILNYRWQEMLPESNIAAFQKIGYGYQWPKREGQDGLHFIFGRSDGDPATYPVTNSMQKAMQELIKREPLRAGGMVLTVEQVKGL